MPSLNAVAETKWPTLANFSLYSYCCMATGNMLYGEPLSRGMDSVQTSSYGSMGASEIGAGNVERGIGTPVVLIIWYQARDWKRLTDVTGRCRLKSPFNSVQLQ